MDNSKIIAEAAISAGIFTEADVMAYTAAGMQLPLHTFQAWAEQGLIVQKGQHARMVAKIWKPTVKKNKETGQEEQGWILTPAYFFTSDQVAPATT